MVYLTILSPPRMVWIVKNELEKMVKEAIVAKSEAAPIPLGCLDGLRKTTNNLSQDSRVSAEIRRGSPPPKYKLE
jgi:hypothetical protein